MYYGQFSDETWGSDDEATRFVSFVEIPTDEWFSLLDKADSTGKIIGHDEKGYPILTDPPEPSVEEKASMRIDELKRYLSSTDYVVIKIAEGVASREEYAETLAERKKAREEIKALSQELS